MDGGAKVEHGEVIGKTNLQRYRFISSPRTEAVEREMAQKAEEARKADGHIPVNLDLQTGAGITSPSQWQVEIPPGAVGSNAYETEDEFQNLYLGGINSRGVIMPPYNPRSLDLLCQINNSLTPCCEAMVTNIEGTGYGFAKEGIAVETDLEDENVQKLKSFFKEPWPGESFISIREKLRRDIERVGNGYLEIIKNAAGDIVFIRHVDAKMVRILLLDTPVLTTKKLFRDGKEVSIKVMMRERRYCMLANLNRLTYFAEFGSSRDLHKMTGVWAPPGQRLAANVRATEFMHFIALPDMWTPYGVPRWISQMPSVVGSRKAEEYNLEYFDEGGVPPLLILIQGGALTPESRNALQERMNGKAAKKQRVEVFEAEPTGGAIDSPSTARITVERFGNDRQHDAMFQTYDANNETRVRRSFRLPPIFVGDSTQYSFATAYASYTVAEAQVFSPERNSFDERISLQILPAMGYRGYRLQSEGLHINDITAQLNGVSLSQRTNRVSPEDIIGAINAICGLKLQVTAKPVLPWLVPGIDPTTGRAQDKAVGVMPPEAVAQSSDKSIPGASPQATPTKNNSASIKKAEHYEGPVGLAVRAHLAMRKRDLVELHMHVVRALQLSAEDQAVFRETAGLLYTYDPEADLDGLGEVQMGTAAVLANEAGRGAQA